MTLPEKRAIRLSAGTAVWALLSFMTLFMVIMSMDIMQKLSSISPLLSVSLVMPIIMAGLTLAMLVSAILVWKNKYWTALRRVHYISDAFGCPTDVLLLLLESARLAVWITLKREG